MRYTADNCIDSLKSAMVLSVMVAFLVITPGSSFGQIVKPDDAPNRITLLDENVSLADALNEGTGTAEFISTDKQDGLVCLKIEPPQRHSPRIQGWSFPIRETPATPPREWTVVTRDLWQDMGDFTLTGIAPTAMGSPALFDRIELLQSIAP